MALNVAAENFKQSLISSDEITAVLDQVKEQLSTVGVNVQVYEESATAGAYYALLQASKLSLSEFLITNADRIPLARIYYAWGTSDNTDPSQREVYLDLACLVLAWFQKNGQDPESVEALRKFESNVLTRAESEDSIRKNFSRTFDRSFDNLDDENFKQAFQSINERWKARRLQEQVYCEDHISGLLTANAFRARFIKHYGADYARKRRETKETVSDAIFPPKVDEGGFEERREEMVAETEVSFVTIDLAKLKLVNDVLGLTKGNDFLAIVGAVVREEFRKADLVARQGDEYFVSGAMSREAMEVKLEAVAKSVREKTTPFRKEIKAAPNLLVELKTSGRAIGVANEPEAQDFIDQSIGKIHIGCIQSFSPQDPDLELDPIGFLIQLERESDPKKEADESREAA